MSALVDQVAFDLDGLEARVVPTTAMRRGEQLVSQHSWCGAVVVWRRTEERTELGACPVCEGPADGWWKQVLPVAGVLSNQEPGGSR